MVTSATGETPADFARLWAEFADPAGPIPGPPDPSAEEPEPAPEQVFRVDLTWLTSRWTCIYGNGCPGVYADRPDDGCCSLGAHFTDEEDEARVRAAAKRLTPAQWQLRVPEVAEVIEIDPDGERKTRVVQGACIFLNRPDGDAEPGCALHQLAVADGVEPHTLKPDVCWQLPIRRSYRTVERPDGSSYLEVTITEFDRRGWGEGGHHLDWYCSSNAQAHVGTQPVYLSLRAELTELIGAPAYAELARHCAALERRRLPLGVFAPHPATVAAQAQAAHAEHAAAQESAAGRPGAVRSDLPGA